MIVLSDRFQDEIEQIIEFIANDSIARLINLEMICIIKFTISKTIL